MTTEPKLVLEEDDGVTVISFDGDARELTEDVVSKVAKPMLATAESMTPKLVLDLSNVSFFGSSFIELMFRLWRRVNGRDGGQFALAGVRGHCLDVLEVTNLTKVWTIYPNRDTAIRALRAGKHG
jgi:anti-anti-sigma factor